MARKTSIEFEGALYHVIVRGNQKRKVFRSGDDYRIYLEILQRYKSRYQFALYAYVLMTNHIHLLIETGKIPLNKILQGINQSYTMYFNRKYKTVGHLFQGRYKSILCEKDAYLLALVKYIHLNPVRARIAQSPDGYPWSSHGAYVSNTAKGELVDNGLVLKMFSQTEGSARKMYRSFMGEDIVISKKDVYCTVDQRMLGGSGFVEETITKHKLGVEQRRKKQEYSLEEMAVAIEREYGITLENMRSRSRSKAIAVCRRLFSIAASEYGYKGKDIGAFLHKDPAMISRHMGSKEALTENAARFLTSIEKRNNKN
jgi:REP element-mobilizing transposase RayT